jgi:uncharacterized membrane protein
MDNLERERRSKISKSNSAAMSGMGGMIPLVMVIFVIVSIVSAIIFFGKNLLVKVVGDEKKMDIVRNEKTETFVKRGETFSADEAKVKKAEFESFLTSGISYRLEGVFEYGYYEAGRKEYSEKFGYYDASKVTLSTNVNMSYNAEDNVYKFIIENDGGDTKLNEIFRIADGTYYVIQENGKTYLLSDINGKKSAVDVNQNSKTYNFLTSYRMEKVIYTSVFDSPDTERYFLWDSNLYLRPYKDIGYMVFTNPKTELRVYKEKPVFYVHRIKNNNTGYEYQFIINYFYDDITKDKPLLKDYK